MVVRKYSEQLKDCITTVIAKPEMGVGWAKPPLQPTRRDMTGVQQLTQPARLFPLPCLVVPSSLRDSSTWSTVVSHGWHFSEHINVLELRAVLSAVRWLMSHPRALCTRAVLCTDSAVGFHILKKGRSSSSQLLLLMRKIAAMLLVSGVSVIPLWLPTSVNPADDASRAVGKTKRIKPPLRYS